MARGDTPEEALPHGSLTEGAKWVKENPPDRTQLEQDIVDFERRFADKIGQMQTLHDSKRKRYTGSADPLENYLTCSDWIARMLDQQFPEAGAFVRSRGALFAMIARHGEKFQRLVTMVGQPDFLDPNQGEGEGIGDTLMDISIIAFLEDIEAWRLRKRARIALEENDSALK